ncbi:MAG: hypothetical protein WD278_09965 [Pirellulales bacterium]
MPCFLSNVTCRPDKSERAATGAVMPPRQEDDDRDVEEATRDALDVEKQVDRIIEAISASKPPLEFETLFREFDTLLAGGTAAELEQLRFHKNLSIALSAAWEEVRLAIRRLPRGTPVDLGTARFLGYVEGRLGVPVPEIWGNVVAGARAQDRGLAKFKRPDTGYGRAAPGISVTRRGNSLFLQSGDVLVPLPLDVRKQLPNDMSVQLGQQEGYVAVSDSMLASSFPLFRIDPQSGEILWKTEVWGSGFTPIQSGVGFYHWVGLVREKELLIVFGVDFHAAYIEGFAVADGSNVFRFTTAYSFISLARGDRR